MIIKTVIHHDLAAMNPIQTSQHSKAKIQKYEKKHCLGWGGGSFSDLQRVNGHPLQK